MAARAPVLRSHRGRAAAAGACGFARAGVAEIERLAGAASAGGADRRFGRDRQLTAAERAWRARRIRILAGVEGIATAAAGRRRHALRRLLDDRRRSRDLRVITRLALAAGAADRPAAAAEALRRGWAAAVGRRRRRWRGGAALKRPQALLELPVAVLQLLVLAGELPQPGSQAAGFAFPDPDHRTAGQRPANKGPASRQWPRRG